MPGEPPGRDASTDRIEDHLRRYGAEISRVVDIFARRHRMTPHDVHGLVVIMNAQRQGNPATPGELQRALTLTSGAVTGVIDRLARAGHVRREADPDDRRRTRLYCDDEGQRLGREFFGPLARRTRPITDGRSAAELAVVERFLGDIVAATVDYREELERPPSTAR
jgi:DNA-binding MarR family transcriptional regulator